MPPRLPRLQSRHKPPPMQSALLLQPQMPFWRMRLIPVLLAPLRTLFYNENLDHFMIRPNGVGNIGRHFAWRTKNFVRWQTSPGGHLYTFLWRLKHPSALRAPALWELASAMGKLALLRKQFSKRKPPPVPGASLPAGISVLWAQAAAAAKGARRKG